MGAFYRHPVKKRFCHIMIYYPNITFIRKSCNWKNHSFGGRKEDLRLNPSNKHYFSVVRTWAGCLHFLSAGLLTCETGIKKWNVLVHGKISKIMYV